MELKKFNRTAVSAMLAATLVSGCIPMPMHMKHGNCGHGAQGRAVPTHIGDMTPTCVGMREKMIAGKTPEERMAVMHAQMQSMPAEVQQRMHERMRSMSPEARGRMHNNPETMCD